MLGSPTSSTPPCPQFSSQDHRGHLSVQLREQLGRASDGEGADIAPQEQSGGEHTEEGEQDAWSVGGHVRKWTTVVRVTQTLVTHSGRARGLQPGCGWTCTCRERAAPEEPKAHRQMGQGQNHRHQGNKRRSYWEERKNGSGVSCLEVAARLSRSIEIVCICVCT